MSFKSFDYEYIKYLIITNKYKPNDYIDELNMTLFEYIIQWKIDDYDLIECMLEHGADTTTRKLNSPLLIYAVQNNNIKLAELLLKYHADPNLVETCVTPLNIAVHNNNIELANILIKNGADPNFMNRNKRIYSAVETAVKNRNLNMLKILMENGGDINKIQNARFLRDILIYDFDFIHVVLSYGFDFSKFTYSDSEINIIFLYLYSIDDDDNYEEVDIEDVKKKVQFLFDNGVKAQSSCAIQALGLSATWNRLDLLHIFKDNGFDFSKKYYDGNVSDDMSNYFFIPWIHDNLDILKFLISAGVDVKHTYLKDNVITYLDSHANHMPPKTTYEVIKLFVENGADVNYSSFDKSTPLFAAIAFESLDAVEYLISKGADINVVNDYEQTPLMLASELKNGIIFQAIYESNPKTKKYDYEIYHHFQQNPEFGASLYLKDYDINQKPIQDTLIESGFYEKLYFRMTNAQKDNNKNYRILVEKVNGIGDLAKIIINYKNEIDKVDILTELFSNH